MQNNQKESFGSFKILNTMLCSVPIVAYFRFGRTYALTVDASIGTDTVEGGLRAILTQIDKDVKFHAISYTLKQLIKHENNYFPFPLVMESVVWAMEYYHKRLRVRKFILHTDHKPLE
jgi:hypothetical protein